VSAARILVAEAPKGDVYADEPWLTIRWDSAHNCVHGEWKAFATSVEFRAGLMKGLEAIRDKRATGYVSDTRKAKSFDTLAEAFRWVAEA
jgi:hypothetical protein